MVKVAWLNFAGNGEAIALGESRGMVKTIFDAGSGAHGGDRTSPRSFRLRRRDETGENNNRVDSISPHPKRVETMCEPVLDAYGRVVPF